MKYLGDEVLVQRLIFLLFDSLKNAYNNYLKEKTYYNLILFQNNIIYLMIICLNLKNNQKFNYYLIKEKIEYLTCLISSIKTIDEKDKKSREIFYDILYNLFSTEYKHLNLNLLINNNEENKKNNNKSENIITNFYNSRKDKQKDNDNQEKLNKKIVEFLFNYDSENFLNFKKENFIDIDERFFYQLEIVKSILLILFSKEKYKYLNDKKEEEIFYEYDFLNKVINKNVKETKDANGDRYKDLFRRENITNDIIKYIFFIFGNQLIIECLVKPLNIILNITGINNEFEIISEKGKSLNMERDISKDEFNILFDKILEKLTKYIPHMLKVLLKMIYESVLQHYTIDKNNYIPIGVVLLFNYIASPRIQKIYSIHPNKYIFIKSMNKLLCNTCFKIQFSEKDPLNIFNKDIDIYSEKINNFFEKNILNIDLNDVENKRCFKNVFDKLNVECPSFLFNINCDFLETISIIDKSKNE